MDVIVCQLTSLCGFLWTCLPSKLRGQECLLAENLSCEQISPAWYGRLGDDSSFLGYFNMLATLQSLNVLILDI